MPEDIKNKVKQIFLDSTSVKKEIIDDESYKVLIEASDTIDNSIANGGKLLPCDKGASTADALHLAAEFLLRLASEVNIESIPALSLSQDIGLIKD